MNPGVVLDLCGAPGGFVQVLSLYTTDITTLLLVDDYDSCVRLLDDVYIDDIFKRNFNEEFDYVVADGTVEDSYKDDPIFLREIEIVMSVLKESGVMINIVKHNNYFNLNRNFINEIACYFSQLAIVKPYTSRMGNTECYVVGVQFSFTRYATVDIYDCGESYFIDEINSYFSAIIDGVDYRLTLDELTKKYEDSVGIAMLTLHDLVCERTCVSSVPSEDSLEWDVEEAILPPAEFRDKIVSYVI